MTNIYNVQQNSSIASDMCNVINRQDEAEKKIKERDQWGGKTEFLLACIGNAVGLGNVWRFPYLAYKNGGGAFVIPYIVMVFTIGIPLFLIELSLGQYSAMGPAHLYAEMSPIFKGVGIASIVATFLVSIYYNMIISWTIFYFYESFFGQKWQFCGQEFNTLNCSTSLESSVTNRTNISRTSAPEEFFNNYILNKSNGIDEIGTINWKLVIFLLIAWIIVIASLIKGIKSSGKVVYFTATFPYVILIILFFRGITLDGAFEGLRFYVVPNFEKIQDPQVWRDAAIQVFYSFGIAGGGMLTYASYNKFNSNIVRHCLLIGICDMLTSLFAGVVIFAMLGFMAKTLNKSVSEVVQGGIGLAFIAIPDGLTQMPLPMVWCLLYFAMLFLLGIDSQFAAIETITTYIFDSIRNKNERNKVNKPLVVTIVGVVMFILGIPLCTSAGLYILELLDHYAAGFPYLFIALMEVLIVCIFGIKKYFHLVHEMCAWRPGLWLKSHLTVLITTIAPIVLIVLLVMDLIELADPEKPLKSSSYVYPNWTRVAGWITAGFSIMMIPFGTLHHLIFNKTKNFWERCKLGFKSTDEFHKNANKFYQNIVGNGCENNGYFDEEKKF